MASPIASSPPRAPSPEGDYNGDDETKETTPEGLDQMERAPRVPPYRDGARAWTPGLLLPSTPPQGSVNSGDAYSFLSASQSPPLPSSPQHHQIQGSSGQASVAESSGAPLITPGVDGGRGDRRRWLVMAVFCLVAAAASFGWALVPCALGDAAAAVYMVPPSFLALLLALVPGALLLAAPYAAYVATLERGVKACVAQSAWLTLLAALLRAAPYVVGGGPTGPFARVALILAQILGGVATALSLVTPSAAASAWFAARHRAAATGLTLAAHLAGFAVALFVVSATEATTPQVISHIELGHFACAAAIALLATLLPALPRNPPSITGARHRMAMHRTRVRVTSASVFPAALRGTLLRYLRTVRLAFVRRAAVALLFVTGLQGGAAVAWWVSLPRVLLETGSTLSPARAQWLGFSGSMSGVIACVVLPALPLVRRRHKSLAAMALLGQALVGGLLLAIAAAPTAHVPEALLGPTCLTALVMLIGIFCGAAAPLLLELVAESSYPSPAGVPTALSCVIGAAIVLTTVILGARISAATGVFGVAMPAAASVCALLSLVILACTRVRYVRLDLDEGLDLVDNPIAP